MLFLKIRFDMMGEKLFFSFFFFENVLNLEI